jgi:ATP-dependent protease HslVU (ClpYQ) ATPase subunit
MATPEFAHLPPDVRPIAALDAEARIAHIRAERWVQHAAAGRVLGYLQEALEQPPRERMENILLIGESGMGKTMLVRKFERQNAAPFDDRGAVFQPAASRTECAVAWPF